jgi:sterol desaturase/sphingolipid hydroxylase (fatty acid hydroxylase superfamily)
VPDKESQWALHQAADQLNCESKDLFRELIMKKPYQSIRVFENPYLEKLTHVHPITPLLVWVPIISFLYYYSFTALHFTTGQLMGLLFLGLFVWTLAEYYLHRYVFHFNATTPLQKRLQFLIHGLHHDDPNDPTRLVMPPAGSLILAVILYSLFRAVFGIFGAADASVPFFAAFAIGYLCYDYIHYGTHHFKPTSRLGKMIKQHHMLHHFVDHDAKWGVSSPIWDYLLNTMKGPSAQAAASSRNQSSAKNYQPSTRN